MNCPDMITVVLDPECGEAIFEYAKRGPVWATHSDRNCAAIQTYWKTKSDDANTVTYWSKPRTGDTEDEWLSILDDLEVHHTEGWGGPGIAAVEVVGAELTPQARTALREFGYEPAEILPNGFRAIRGARSD